MTYASLLKDYPDNLVDHGPDTNFQIELNMKFAGYIDRQRLEISKLSYVEGMAIPTDFDYLAIQGLRNEARQKLIKTRPHNLGQALRISGVSPADISILMISLNR
jgi:tRNA uridine 5-carboxymethylaminomethyl modification enzyme